LQEPIPIRAHHLLCVAAFRGLGYSDSFVENVEQVVAEIRRGPRTGLKLLDTCDVICSGCPYNIGGECRKESGSEEKVRSFDLKVLSLLGLSSGDVLPASRIYRLLARRMKPEVREKLCGRCSWWRSGACSVAIEGFCDQAPTNANQ